MSSAALRRAVKAASAALARSAIEAGLAAAGGRETLAGLLVVPAAGVERSDVSKDGHELRVLVLPAAVANIGGERAQGGKAHLRAWRC